MTTKSNAENELKPQLAHHSKTITAKLPRQTLWQNLCDFGRAIRAEVKEELFKMENIATLKKQIAKTIAKPPQLNSLVKLLWFWQSNTEIDARQR